MHALMTMPTLLAAGGTEVILPAMPELVYGAIAFLIFLGVMARYAFPRLNTVLEERAESIQGRIEAAQEQLSEAERIRENYRQQLSDARSQANRIVEEARENAESLRRDIIEKAEAEAEAIVERAQAEVRAERDRAVQQLRSEVGRLSVRLAEKIVQKELDRDSHQSLIDDYIDSLAGPNGAGPSRS